MSLHHNYSMHSDYHPPPPPPTLYRPPSPTSSTNSSDNSNERTSSKLLQEQSIRIDTASQIPGSYNPFDTSPNANPSRPSSSSPPERTSVRFGTSHHRHHPDAVFPPEYQPGSSSASVSYHSRRSPPPEPTFPTSQPGQQPAAWADFAYVPPPTRASPPAASASADPIVPTPPSLSGAPETRPDAPPIAAWRQPSPTAQGIAATADDANVDQLIYELISPTRPGMVSPPESPPIAPTAAPEPSSHASGSRGSVVLASEPPTTSSLPPVYHSHLQYPISPPGGKTDVEGKTYTFLSLPGNIIKKRPRRKPGEIERLYRCNYQDCSKSYGTLNHLNAHVHMQRHGAKRTPGEFKEMRKVWRKQRKEAEVDLDEPDDDDDSMVAGPSSAGNIGPSAPYSRGPRPKRRRRATEPSLPSIATLEESMEEEYAGLGTGLRDQPFGHTMTGGVRRVSMGEYMEGSHHRRVSAESHEETIPEEEEEEEGNSPGMQRSVSDMSVAIRAGNLQLSPLAGPEPPLSSVRYWQQQQQQQQQQPQQHEQPPLSAPQEPLHLHPVGTVPIDPPRLVQQDSISPSRTVMPHASHLPGPGPAAPTTRTGLGLDTQQRHVYPPAVPRTGARHPSLTYPGSQQGHIATVVQPPPLSPPPLQQARLEAHTSHQQHQQPRSIQQVVSSVMLAPTPQTQPPPPTAATSHQHQQVGRIGLTYPMSPQSSAYPVTPPSALHSAYPASPVPAQQTQPHGSHHAQPTYPPTTATGGHATFAQPLTPPPQSLQGGSGYPLSPPSFPASPPRTEPLQSEQRLHAGSMLLTPLSVGHPHRLPYVPSVVSPTNYVSGGSSLAGAVGTPDGRGPGLPVRYGVTPTSNRGAADPRGIIQQLQYGHQREQRYEAPVQQSQSQWDVYPVTSSTHQHQHQHQAQQHQQHLYHQSGEQYDVASSSRTVAPSRTSYVPTPPQSQVDEYAQQRAEATYLASPVLVQRTSSLDAYSRYIPPSSHPHRQETYPAPTTATGSSHHLTDTLGYGRGQHQAIEQPQATTYESHQPQRLDSYTQGQQMAYYSQQAASETHYAPPQQAQHGHPTYGMHQQHQQQSQQVIPPPMEPSSDQYATLSPQHLQPGNNPPPPSHQAHDPRVYTQYGARGDPGPSDGGY
ncbi:hypothetical protein FRB96_003991 [Tulasnella sp. 330]|nr:hypothetical protein FRB96_003991 [Tulasnella sp. 330]